MAKLTNEERRLSKSFGKGEWKSVANLERRRRQFREYARDSLRKDRRVNIRISGSDLEAIQMRAMEEGIPYQTLIASLLHKYAAGRLVERNRRRD
jgi:predicted DNA binding CopG/RHH family protein